MVKPHNVGHILQVDGADPERDRAVFEIGGVRTIVVVVPDPAQAAAVAAELIEEESVALIEVDGGLGITGAARVVEAVAGAVPSGAVMFGAESLVGAGEFVTRYNEFKVFLYRDADRNEMLAVEESC
jgi:Family of unknown function (DUF6506)